MQSVLPAYQPPEADKEKGPVRYDTGRLRKMFFRNNQEMKKKKLRADIFLIGGVLAAGLVLGLILLLAARSGKVVKVRVSGQVVRTFSLDETVRYEIDGAGGGKNVLVIEGGKARMEAADCPDGLCMKMGKIHLSGQSVVCLPHKVVIEITEAANNDGEEVDIMVE